MSLQCHGTGIDGAAACVIKMYEDAPASLYSSPIGPLSPSVFASSRADTRRCFSPGMRPERVSKKCRGSLLRLAFSAALLSATESNWSENLLFLFRSPSPLSPSATSPFLTREKCNNGHAQDLYQGRVGAEDRQTGSAQHRQTGR